MDCNGCFDIRWVLGFCLVLGNFGLSLWFGCLAC